MKALVKNKSELGLWLQDVPEPTLGINDVLIRIDRTGICGTDVHIYKWDRSEEHTSELQSRLHLVCRLLLEKKKKLGRMIRLRKSPDVKKKIARSSVRNA